MYKNSIYFLRIFINEKYLIYMKYIRMVFYGKMRMGIGNKRENKFNVGINYELMIILCY